MAKGRTRVWAKLEKRDMGNIPPVHSAYDQVTYHVAFTVSADEIKRDRENVIRMARRQAKRMLRDQIEATEVRF